MSYYYDTRLGIVNNYASPSTFGWSAIDNTALNSVFTNFFNKFSANSAQTANNADLSTISNPFSFGSLASGWSLPAMNWSFPQTNWSLASTSSGGDWFSNIFGSLSSGWSSGFPSLGGSNSGPIDAPAFLSQNNRNKIFGSGNIQPLDTDMQRAVIELMKRAHAKGIDFEIKEGYCAPEVRAKRYYDALKEGKGREVRYAKPADANHPGSRHTFGKAIDIVTSNLTDEQIKTLAGIWRDDMGFTYGMDFSAFREKWHFDLRPNIRKFPAVNPTNKGWETTWLGKGGQPSYAGGGYSSPWGGFDFTFPSFSSSMGGFGSGFGGSWFNTTFSSNLGGWGSGRSSTRALPSQYSGLIQRIADEQGADAKFISCLMHDESDGDKTATSSAGARGLLQLMPDTARRMGVTNITDPEQNIRGGIKFMNMMLAKYHGDKRLALAAYNWGPAKVDRAIEKANSNNYDVVAPYIYSGTRDYVASIMRRYNSSGGGGYLTA